MSFDYNDIESTRLELVKTLISSGYYDLSTLVVMADELSTFVYYGRKPAKPKIAYKKYSGPDKLSLGKPKKKRRYTKKSKFWGKKKVA